jgi:hypothetical protein
MHPRDYTYKPKMDTHGWGELKANGLIDWREEDVPCHDGSKMVYVHLTITDKGYAHREEDLRKWRDEE